MNNDGTNDTQLTIKREAIFVSTAAAGLSRTEQSSAVQIPAAGVSTLAMNIVATTGSGTWTFATDTITTSAAHGLSVNDSVHFSTSGTLPSDSAYSDPLIANYSYIVVAVPSSTQIQIGHTRQSAAMTLTGGSGTHTWRQGDIDIECNGRATIDDEVYVVVKIHVVEAVE